MPSSCCAIGCVSRYSKDKGVKLFRFPIGKKQREAWIRAIWREKWIPNDYSRICQLHFISGRPSRDSNDPDFVPTVFSFSKENDEGTCSKKTARHDRFLRRRLMNMTNPVLRSIQVSGESVPTEQESREHSCSEDSESVSELFCQTLVYKRSSWYVITITSPRIHLHVCVCV